MARKEFDLEKCVSKDLTRYFLTGVFHENGCKIATDGRVLACVPAVYPAEWENKIIDWLILASVAREYAEKDCTKRLMIGENIDFVFEPVGAVENTLNIDGVLFNYLMSKNCSMLTWHSIKAF